MPANYEVIQVAKGALIYECKRCGAVVLHPTVHDTWHAAVAHWAYWIPSSTVRSPVRDE